MSQDNGTLVVCLRETVGPAVADETGYWRSLVYHENIDDDPSPAICRRMVDVVLDASSFPLIRAGSVLRNHHHLEIGGEDAF